MGGAFRFGTQVGISHNIQSTQVFGILTLNHMSIDWNNIAGTFFWYQPWDQVSSGSFRDANIQWFTGGKTNIAVNCLDRHLQTEADKIALIWEPNNPADPVLRLSYQQLHEQVCAVARALRAHGVKKGDRVCLYLPMIPELLISVLACARIGAVHTVVFAGFSAKSLRERIADSGSTLLITADVGFRGAKTVKLKSVVDEALDGVSPVKTVVVVEQAVPGNASIGISKANSYSHRPTNQQTSHGGYKEVSWNLFQDAGQNATDKPEQMDSEDPLFILYTSGSTGKPKGLLHTTGGYMVNAGHTFRLVFDYQDDDIYWCTADIGWITGHTYLVYGPLLNAATVVMFEGVPTWPDPGRFWDVIEKHSISIFYTAPTAIRALEKEGNSWPKSHDLSSLRVLGTVGEPINEEAWQWYHQVIGGGRCPVIDTWWQTETGAVMIAPVPNTVSLEHRQPKPGYAGMPLPGIEPCLVGEDGVEITDDSENGSSGNVMNDGEGALCIKKPWPSIARTIWGDHNRYMQTYLSRYPGMYCTGDGARREGGQYRITGRIDDVINVSGHRLGTAEIEDAIDEHEVVVETAVVGYPHTIKGQGICAFVICQEHQLSEKRLSQEIRSIVSEHIGPIAKPDLIVIARDLPKTRSGKIMRRILRAIAAGSTEYGDTSTLLDPTVVEELRTAYAVRGK